MSTDKPSISAKVVKIADLFSENLAIPDYQRPYKWPVRNVNLLMDDLLRIGKEKDVGEYRLGTIIVVPNSPEDKGRYPDDVLFVVDGQQRVVTLALLVKALVEKCGESEGAEGVPKVPGHVSKDKYLNNPETQAYLRRNYKSILSRLMREGNRKETAANLKKALKQLTFVLITATSQKQAFQIFDTQNRRGKTLAPHDLLKAYHLRCVADDNQHMAWKRPEVSSHRELNASSTLALLSGVHQQYMEFSFRCVTQKEAAADWENRSRQEMVDFFNDYLYRILCWKSRQDARGFTKNDIDVFKGLRLQGNFPAVKRALAADLNFEIGEPFIAGAGFFELVKHYFKLKTDVCDSLKKQTEAFLGEEFWNACQKNVGFRYAWNLFECVALCFCDRFGKSLLLGEEFGNGRETTPTSYFICLITWSFLPRLYRKRLGFSSINKYVRGDEDKFQSVNMFDMIAEAYLPNDILSVNMTYLNDHNSEDGQWEYLRTQLKGLNGVEDDRTTSK